MRSTARVSLSLTWVAGLIGCAALVGLTPAHSSAQGQGELISNEELFGSIESLDLASFFESIEGPATFVLAEGMDGEPCFYNPERGAVELIFSRPKGRRDSLAKVLR